MDIRYCLVIKSFLVGFFVTRATFNWSKGGKIKRSLKNQFEDVDQAPCTNKKLALTKYQSKMLYEYYINVQLKRLMFQRIFKFNIKRMHRKHIVN